MIVELSDNPSAVEFKQGKVYKHRLRDDYWLCVNAPYSGGLMLVNLESGSAWDSGPQRAAPASLSDWWEEVSAVKVVVG